MLDESSLIDRLFLIVQIDMNRELVFLVGTTSIISHEQKVFFSLASFRSGDV